MAKKISKPKWSDVKPGVAGLDHKGLVALVSDLYALSKDNRDFLHARFDPAADPLAAYKEIIDGCMHPDVMRNRPVQIAKAKRAISAYSRAAGTPLGEAELMTYFVERGNAFTVEFGDVDEGFYDALLGMFGRAVRSVLEFPEPEREALRRRLGAIVESSSGIGWGYHDGLCDEYYEAFPDDE
ncbi:MAG: hypothetical protein ACYDA8_06400 [Deferrisomatales bacterium]